MIIVSAISQGLLYAPLAIGIYIAFKILNTPDLTVDGSFVFGMVVCTVITIAGYPVLALLAGTLAGALAGIITGIMQTKFKINPILAGILTMTGLYSINYMVLGGKSNQYLQKIVNNIPVPSNTVYKSFSSLININNDTSDLILTLIIVVIILITLAIFFKTRLGMAIRATGDNEEMVRSSSINANLTRIIGITLGNALVGLSGALICQQQNFADLNFGTGMLVMGLAAVIIGLIIFQNVGITVGLISATIGSIGYRIIINLAYQIDMPSYMVKLISSLIVAMAMIIPIVKVKIVSYKRKKLNVGGSL